MVLSILLSMVNSVEDYSVYGDVNGLFFLSRRTFEINYKQLETIPMYTEQYRRSEII